MTNNTENNLDNLDNIDFIRFMNRAILKEAYKMMTEGVPGDNKVEPGEKLAKPANTKAPDGTQENFSISALDLWSQRNFFLSRYLRMWGKDTPTTDVLESITDNELKIEKQRPANVVQQKKAPPLNDREMELLREVVEKEARDE